MKWIDRLWGHVVLLCIASVVVGLAAGAVVLSYQTSAVEWTWAYWGAHRANESGTTLVTFDRSSIFRNFGLAALALLGLGLAIWRSVLLHKQTKIGLRQADTAEKGLMIDRYQQGAQMLETENLTVRVAGVFALRELAMSYPEEYYIQVLSLMYGHIREESQNRKEADGRDVDANGRRFQKFSNDLIEMLESCNQLRKTFFLIDKQRLEENWRPNLVDANLSGVAAEAYIFSNANLNAANLDHTIFFNVTMRDCSIRFASIRNAELSSGDFFRTDFRTSTIEESNFWDSKLSETNFGRTILSKVDFSEADLTNANFTFAKTNELDFSFADLSGARMRGLDLETSKFEETNLSGVDFKNTDVVKAAGISTCWAWQDRPPRFDVSFEAPDITVFAPGLAGSIREAFYSANRELTAQGKPRKTIPHAQYKV
ncbi:pentapeptide repeat-containing protein [Roseibium polysiphoniae]|uniref:pentapeptide repeat-containing protein n=1 Tax=Roseibium polysiphoniae TaxID=2571221 RepID=UPI0032970B04